MLIGAENFQMVVGNAPSWILVLIALTAAYRLTRGGGGSAVSELTAANKVLEESLSRTRDALAAEEQRIKALEARTDVVLAVTPLMQEMDRKAQARFDETVQVLRQISDTLARVNKGGTPA